MHLQNRRSLPSLFAAAIAAIAATPLAVPATGQALVATPAPQPLPNGPYSVGGDAFVEAWVDADFNIVNPAVGDPARAFADIADAIDAVFSQVSFNIQNDLEPREGLVHVNPGIYEVDEPIVIRPNVHIQGKAAHACVIRPSEDMSRLPVFLPIGGVCGTFAEARVLMNVQTTQDGPVDAVVEVIEGLQFQGGDVQLYIQKQGPGALTLANCIFDMLPEQDTPGPVFGALLVENWDLAIPGYNPFDASFLNNTFIQGAFLSEGGVVEGVAGRPDGVALASVNNPICTSPFGDPNPVLRQVYPLNVQNNLFRSIPGAARTSMIGISEDDAAIGVGVPIGPSNAFTRGTAGSTSLVGNYNSLPIGGDPVPAVDSGTFDPKFVGECAQALLGSFGVPFGDRRDWRLLAKSPLRDRGSTPVDTGLLESVSGVGYQDFYDELRPRSAFDWDGEHYGNRRVVGGRVDIGADEVNEFHLVARVNDSLTPLFGGREFGLVDRPGRVRLRHIHGQPTTTAWSSPPGSRVPPLLLLLAGGGLDFNWLLDAYTVDPWQDTVPFDWTNPGDGVTIRVNYFTTSLPGNSYSQVDMRPRGLTRYLTNTQYTE